MSDKTKKRIDFNKHFKIANIFSTCAIIFCLSIFFLKGLNLGIDFKGGTLIEIRSESGDINIKDLRSSISNLDIGDVSVKNFGSKQDFIIKLELSKNKNSENVNLIKNKISSYFNDQVSFRRVENVGPKVSNELINSGILAIALSLSAMLIYIWIRFEWQFSLAAILALLHDVIFTLGIFSLFSYEINLSIVAAILTIVGYSMNDTVVIFDRIRENLRKYNHFNIIEISNISINETLSRTIITSLTTLLALFSIYFVGGEILRGFSFAMIVGVIIGTFSSIFVATPFLKFTNVTQKTVNKEEK
jgi:preprotein translocase SecF subunit|tara:strand:+ start:268 stop:1176 length:909 start_codon:yes stop_codon:yes gene_type:complete